MYTLVFLNGYFYLSDGFYKALSTQKRWAMVIAHYLATDVVWITLMYTFAMKRYIRFGRGYFFTWAEHFKIVPLYSLIISFFATITSSKTGLLYRILLPLSHMIIDITLVKMDILKVNIKQFLITSSRYFLMTFISRFLYKTIQNRYKPGR
ncbi:MAG: hypothetical protein Q8935_14445 [Bacillota bacterium]|nr:hypothetical protein [Bacillota bacterium]